MARRRGKIHATDHSQIQETLDNVNRMLRSSKRAFSIGVSGKEISGYHIHIEGPSSVPVDTYPNKRLVHAFLHGLEKALSLIVAEDLGTGLTISSINEFFSHERIFCPECRHDLTNVVEWVGCSEEHSKAKCPGCGALVLKRSLSDVLIRVFTVKTAPVAVDTPE